MIEPATTGDDGDPFALSLHQVEILLTAMGVSRELIELIRSTISRHTPRDRARNRVASPRRVPTTLGEIARIFYRTSMARNTILGANVIRDAAWHMLLDLFAAAEEGRPISVSSVCIASGVPLTTALRQLHGMIDAGLIVRVPDPHDGRRSWVTLSEDGRARMAEIIENATVPTPVQLVIMP